MSLHSITVQLVICYQEHSHNIAHKTARRPHIDAAGGPAPALWRTSHVCAVNLNTHGHCQWKMVLVSIRAPGMWARVWHCIIYILYSLDKSLKCSHLFYELVCLSAWFIIKSELSGRARSLKFERRKWQSYKNNGTWSHLELELFTVSPLSTLMIPSHCAVYTMSYSIYRPGSQRLALYLTITCNRLRSRSENLGVKLLF